VTGPARRTGGLSLTERSAAVADEHCEIGSQGIMDSDGGRNQGAALVVGVEHGLNPVPHPDTLRLAEWQVWENWSRFPSLQEENGTISPNGLPESRRLPAQAEGSMPERLRFLVGNNQGVTQQEPQRILLLDHDR
jgi:hypothetical protein